MTARTGQTVGLDLGTMQSTVAHLDYDGKLILHRNSDGYSAMPSVVLLGESGRVFVGPSPERVSGASPENVVEAIKLQIGKKDWRKLYDGKKLTPEFISALILRKLKEDLEHVIGPIANAVITVPYYFDDLSRKATQDAGRIAGFRVTDIISEPGAAALAFSWMRAESVRPELDMEQRIVAIFDFGASAFCQSVVRTTNAGVQVLAADCDKSLGGISWTNRLCEYVAGRFGHETASDMLTDPKLRLHLSHECETAKCLLSKNSAVQVNLHCREQARSTTLTVEDFDCIMAELLNRTRDKAENFIRQAETFAKLDDVLLVGGCARIPAVSKSLAEVCGRTPAHDVDPDHVVAEGAAVYAAVLDAREAPFSNRIAGDVIRRLRAVTAVE